MTLAFKAYFRDHFRSKLKLLLCLLIVALVLTLIYSVGGQKDEYTYYDYDDVTQVTSVHYNAYLGLQVFILIVCAYILPVLEFSLFKKRKNLDCAYALPISRRAMGLVHYFVGLICLIVPFTCSYLLNFLLLLRYPEGFYYPPVLGFYFLSLLMGTILYTFFSFLFNQANSTGDGIWFMVLWSFLFFVVVTAMDFVYLEWLEFGKQDFYYNESFLYSSDLGVCWVLLSEIQWEYSGVVEKMQNASLAALWTDIAFIKWFVLWIVVGIGSALGFVFTFGKPRAEKTQEVSESWFGFKLLIPLYAVATMITSGELFVLVVLVVAFVGYIIYRKGFHLKKWDWIMLGLLIPVGILSMIMYNW